MKYTPNTVFLYHILSHVTIRVHTIAEALKGATAYDASSLLTALTARDSFPTFGLAKRISFRGSAPNPDYPRIFNVGQISMKYDIKSDTVVPINDTFFDPFATN